MKKALALLFLSVVFCGYAIAQRYTAYQSRIRDYGEANSTTINAWITRQGTEPVEAVIDDIFTISNNVTWPATVDIRVTPYGRFNILTNTTMTFAGGDFIASHKEVFQGAGIVTGAARFLLLQDEWNGTPGTGDLNNASTFHLILTNALPNTDTNSLDDVTTNNFFAVYTNQLPGAPTSAVSVGLEGSIVGCYPIYVDADTIIITNGEFTAGSTRYSMQTNHVLDVTVAANFDLLYVYHDDSLSTAPSNVVIYSDLTESIDVPFFNGEYNSTNTTDRLLAVLAYTNSALLEFNAFDNRMTFFTNQLEAAREMNPDASWQTPANFESSTVLPVSAARMFFQLHYDQTGSTGQGAITTQEGAAAFGSPIASSFTAPGGFRGTSDTEGFINGWLDLGLSRNVRIAGEDDDDNELTLAIMGWEIKR